MNEETLTVRQAFEKAGYPVPAKSPITYWPAGVSGMGAGWHYEGRKLHSWGYVKYAGQTIYGWDETYDPGSRTKLPDLSTLPSIAAYDLLPEVVRKVVKQ